MLYKSYIEDRLTCNFIAFHISSTAFMATTDATDINPPNSDNDKASQRSASLTISSILWRIHAADFVSEAKTHIAQRMAKLKGNSKKRKSTDEDNDGGMGGPGCCTIITSTKLCFLDSFKAQFKAQTPGTAEIGDFYTEVGQKLHYYWGPIPWAASPEPIWPLPPNPADVDLPPLSVEFLWPPVAKGTTLPETSSEEQQVFKDAYTKYVQGQKLVSIYFMLNLILTRA